MNKSTECKSNSVKSANIISIQKEKRVIIRLLSFLDLLYNFNTKAQQMRKLRVFLLSTHFVTIPIQITYQKKRLIFP